MVSYAILSGNLVQKMPIVRLFYKIMRVIAATHCISICYTKYFVVCFCHLPLPAISVELSRRSIPLRYISSALHELHWHSRYGFYDPAQLNLNFLYIQIYTVGHPNDMVIPPPPTKKKEKKKVTQIHPRTTPMRCAAYIVWALKFDLHPTQVIVTLYVIARYNGPHYIDIQLYVSACVD